MHRLSATREMPEEIYLTASEERWVQERCRELAIEEFNTRLPDWIIDCDGVDLATMFDVVRAAVSAESDGFGHGSRRQLIEAIQALRTEYVEFRADDFGDEALEELQEWEREA